MAEVVQLWVVVTCNTRHRTGEERKSDRDQTNVGEREPNEPCKTTGLPKSPLMMEFQCQNNAAGVSWKHEDFRGTDRMGFFVLPNEVPNSAFGVGPTRNNYFFGRARIDLPHHHNLFCTYGVRCGECSLLAACSSNHNTISNEQLIA